MDWSDRDVVRSAARRAEELGYDEIFSFDHFGQIDPFVPLMVAAEATSRLKVGPLVVDNELHHPALLARTAASVQRLTGGRLVLGMGTGYARGEHDAVGLAHRPAGERVERFGESLAVLRSLLHDRNATFAGRHHHVEVDDLGVDPGSPVPLLVGGNGRRVVGIAARHADIFQFTGLSHAPDGAPRPDGFAREEVERRARWLSEAAGDRDDDIERSALVQAGAVGPDAAGEVAGVAGRLGLGEELLASSPFLLYGSVEQIVDKLERQRAATGISHVVVRDPHAFAPVVAALAGR
jgi:probable F420-dependent oxidoreductase